MCAFKLYKLIEMQTADLEYDIVNELNYFPIWISVDDYFKIYVYVENSNSFFVVVFWDFEMVNICT